MHGETRQHWISVCSQAAIEENPAKLLELAEQIDGMLEQKRKVLEQKHKMLERKKPISFDLAL